MSKDNKKKNVKDDKKNNLVRNYIILAIFILIGVGLTLYFCKVYKVYDDYQKATPVIQGVLSEITSEELNHYVVDNPQMVIYMCTASNENCRYFEKDFKKYIAKESVQDNIIYLNLSETDLDQFITDFNNTYKYKHKLTKDLPALVAFTDGNVDAILQEKKNKKLSVSKAKHFLDIIWAAEDEEEEASIETEPIVQ